MRKGTQAPPGVLGQMNAKKVFRPSRTTIDDPQAGIGDEEMKSEKSGPDESTPESSPEDLDDVEKVSRV